MSFSSTSTNNSHTTITIHSRRRPRVASLFLLFGDPVPTPPRPKTPKRSPGHHVKQESYSAEPWWFHTLPRTRPTSRSPPPFPSPRTPPPIMPSLPSTMPPTPSPSINSPQQRMSALKAQALARSSLYEAPQPIAGPSKPIYHPASAKDLPPTPPIQHDLPSMKSTLPPPTSSIGFADTPLPPPRPSRARRPASVYPHATEEQHYQPQRKYTDPTPRPNLYSTEESPTLHQQLDVDLDAYSTTEYDGEESTDREPTLSFLTSSTADSTASTPSISGSYGFKPVTPDGKPSSEEPRIRVRSTTGRANAYSSAESSTASGAFYGYDNHVYHPHPPPLPTGPIPYHTDQVGLGIGLSAASTDPDNTSTSSAISPTNSFSYRPWRHNVVNRIRSDSAASSLASSETSDTPSAEGDYPYRSYNYTTGARLPWEIEGETQEPAALVLLEEGREKMLDSQKLEALGGVQALTIEVISGLAGITHLLLSSCGPNLATVLPNLLSILAPSLVVLDVSNNGLTALPEQLEMCRSLEELNLSDNAIRHLPTWLSELSELRVLQVDGCRLQGMPAEIGSLSNLHTICARRNRMVALPSWLCLLCQLETLRIDGNPFAADWARIVAPILSTAPRAPESTAGLSEMQSGSTTYVHSITSSSTINTMYSKESPSTSADGWVQSPVSANHSTQHLGILDPIAEDHPHSAPPNGAFIDSPNSADDTIPPRRVRRMQSAGALLSNIKTPNGSSNTSSPETAVEPIMSAFGVKVPSRTDHTSSVLVPPRTSRFASLGSGSGRRATSAMGNYTDDEEDCVVPPLSRLTTSTSGSKTKEGKWGFLRKMSMSRMKSDKGNNHSALSASASANIKLMPPLIHANSDPVPSHPQIHRPGVAAAARSALTLPTRKATSGDVNEFGQTPTKLKSTTLGPNGLPILVGTPTGIRGKRRSFLPIDAGPPLINIAIPSVSPFMPNTAIFDSRENVAVVDLSLDKMETLVESPTQITLVPPSASTQGTSAEQEARYSSGLETIKSYLRDLYDLSRTPIEPYGGFEVVGSADGGYSHSNGSDRAGSPLPAMIGRGSVSDTRRARRPTLNSGLSRNTSSASGLESERDLGESTGSNGKRFKDDKTKRARVLREIYETERTYVRGLGELVSIYVRPAAQLVNPGKASNETVIPSAERKIVFGGVESILTIHRDNFLPALEKAVKSLLEKGDDEEGTRSAQAAHDVGDVFRTYIAYMKQYSTYINNFDNALSRMKTWTVASSSGSVPGTPGFGKPNSPGTISIASAAVSVGMGAAVLPMADTPHTGSPMTTSQRKRVKTFLKRCREDPRHSQINLESYLLLPVQRIPRYKLLLEDLAMCTPPQVAGPSDTLDEALGEISTLAATMNEEKRDAESRLRLFHWQQRISSRGPSPLVQPHRKLVLDGSLVLARLVKKTLNFVEVDDDRPTSLPKVGDEVDVHLNEVDGDHTVGPDSNKTVVQIETLAPEPMDRAMMLILCSDLLVLVQQRNEGWEGTVDLFNVLRMATVREPASMVNGTVLRVVDNKSIYYFNCGSVSNCLRWCRAINHQSRR